MYSKPDYLNFLYWLAEKQRAMIFGLQQLLDQIDDKAVAEVLRRLVQEKQEAYDDVTRLFCSLFGLADEQRRYKREPSLGDVKLRNLDNGKTITCRCLDISLGGVCIQLSDELSQGLQLALEIRFFESRRSIVRRATVRWCKLTGSGQYRAGLQFEAPPAAPCGAIIDSGSAE